MAPKSLEEEDGEEEEQEVLGPDGTFNLGTLDITSTEVSLKGASAFHL